MSKRKEGRATMLVLKDLVRDPRLQVRDNGIDSDQVEDIAEYAKKNGPFKERLKVYRTCLPEAVNVPAQDFLVGGFHRAEGYELAGIIKVPVTLYEGTWSDALRAAARENIEHLGLRRTRADKRRAVELMLLADKTMSARDIAQHINCSHTFVSQMKRELSGEPIEPKKVATLPVKPSSNGSTLDIPLTRQNEAEPEEPAPTKPSPEPRPRQGEEQEFRWADVAVVIGTLVKEIDKCARVHNSKKCLEHQSLLRLMTEVEKEFKQWADYCKKQATKAGAK